AQRVLHRFEAAVTARAPRTGTPQPAAGGFRSEPGRRPAPYEGSASFHRAFCRRPAGRAKRRRVCTADRIQTRDAESAKTGARNGSERIERLSIYKWTRPK